MIVIPVSYTHLDVYKRQEEEEEEEDCSEQEEKEGSKSYHYRQRKQRKIIKWVNYDKNDQLNHKRELVTLFWPFRSEEMDVLNNDAYLQLYDEHFDVLMERRNDYCSGLRLDKVKQFVVEHNSNNNNNNEGGETSEGGTANDVFEDYVQGNNNSDQNQDIDSIRREIIVRTVKNAMSHEDFCKMVRSLNYEQSCLLYTSR